MVAAAAARLRCRRSGPSGSRSSRARTSRPGPGRRRRAAGAARPAPDRPHRRRPGRDRPAQPAAGRRARRAGRHAARTALASARRAAAGRDRARCAPQPGSTPVDDPCNADPSLRRNRVRHELLPAARRRRRPRRGPVAGPPGRPRWPTTPTSLAELAAGLDVTDAVRARPAAAVARSRREPCGGGWPIPTRPTPRRCERVLAVAEGEAVATEVGRGRRVARRRPAAPRSSGRRRTAPVPPSPLAGGRWCGRRGASCGVRRAGPAASGRRAVPAVGDGR